MELLLTSDEPVLPSDVLYASHRNIRHLKGSEERARLVVPDVDGTVVQTAVAPSTITRTGSDASVSSCSGTRVICMENEREEQEKERTQ